MPERAHLPLLAAYLWDLRSQCESQVRELTDAQREIDTVRDSRNVAARRAAHEKIRQDLKQVAAVNQQIRKIVRQAMHEADAALGGANGS
jgi:hypothetical protein